MNRFLAFNWLRADCARPEPQSSGVEDRRWDVDADVRERLDGSHTLKWENPTIKAGAQEQPYESAFHYRRGSGVSDGGFAQAQTGCPRRRPVLRLKSLQKQVKRPHENQMCS